MGGGLDDDLAYWDEAVASPALPMDRRGTNTAGSSRTISVRLDRDNTDALLRKVPDVYRTQVNDVLMTALGRVLSHWTGRDRVLDLAYDPKLFDAGTIRAMVHRLRLLLEGIAGDPDGVVARLPWMSDNERGHVVAECQGTWRDVPAATVPDVFAAQVARTPDAPAVVYGSVTLSYVELDARSNHLANRLVELGVRLEDRVGLLLEPSVGHCIAELAVLKSGGAFPLLVLAVTGSPAMTGLVLGVEAIAQVMVGVLGGALVDRWDHKKIMLTAEATQALAVASLVFALWLDMLSVLHMVVAAALMGVCNALFGPGTEGSKEDCVSHIDEVWTDMRPRSLRERMAASQQD